MDLSKSYEFFNPEAVKERIHVIGCGSVGSTVVELLARFGLTKFTLYDFDVVEPKNIVNQMFRKEHVGQLKVEALKQIVCEINPEAEADIKLQPEGWHGQPLAGYVIMAVDNIDIRRQICKENNMNIYIKGIFDFRTDLLDAQHYAANWSDKKHREDLLNTMNFTNEEADASSPVSACGTVLGVAPTVRLICTLGVSNLVNFIKEGKLKKVIFANAFNFDNDIALAMGN